MWVGAARASIYANMYVFINKHKYTYSICSSVVSCYKCIFTCAYSLIHLYIIWYVFYLYYIYTCHIDTYLNRTSANTATAAIPPPPLWWLHHLATYLAKPNACSSNHGCCSDVAVFSLSCLRLVYVYRCRRYSFDGKGYINGVQSFVTKWLLLINMTYKT